MPKIGNTALVFVAYRFVVSLIQRRIPRENTMSDFRDHFRIGVSPEPLHEHVEHAQRQATLESRFLFALAPISPCAPFPLAPSAEWRISLWQRASTSVYPPVGDLPITSSIVREKRAEYEQHNKGPACALLKSSATEPTHRIRGRLPCEQYFLDLWLQICLLFYQLLQIENSSSSVAAGKIKHSNGAGIRTRKQHRNIE